MTLPMTYSRRKRLREQSGQARVFRSDQFGEKLLVQVFQIISEMNDVLGHEYRIIPELLTYLREELGLLKLNKSYDSYDEFKTFFLEEKHLTGSKPLSCDLMSLN